MAPSAADNADEMFWKAYAAAIKKHVGEPSIGQTTAFYLATQAQRGPPGGDGISVNYTNEGLYQFGDSLLPADNLFYNPSSQNSYIRQLVTYMGWVDVGGSPSGAAITQVTNAYTDMHAAMAAQTTEMDAAITSYAQQQKAQVAGAQSFPQWANANAPNWVTAVKIFKARAAAYDKAYKLAYGPLATEKLDDEAKLRQALDANTASEGFNMPCSLGTPPSPRDINNAVLAGKAIPVPAPVLRPAYNCPGYIAAVQDAQSLVGSTTDPKASFDITFDKGKDVKDEVFNKSAISGGIGFSYVPWLSFSVNGSTSEESQAIHTDSEKEDIHITVFYDDMTLVSINPSASWDLGNVRTKYKKLLPGAPKEVQVLVKPTQLLLATRLGYKIKLGVRVAKTVDTAVHQTTTGGGTFSIFGLSCKIGADITTSTDKTTHSMVWDAANSEIVVKPTDNAGFATVVGVMGEKIPTGA